MDETRLDAKTPAHIFAYKALRGIFVASPESSPTRAPTHEPYSFDDKENTPTPRRGSRFTTSPTKTKRKEADFDAMNAGISLTPKRQKIVQTSPVKSCMKKSNGVPTPRREATVTFKDLRVSISPELARQTVVQQPDFSVVRVAAKVEAEIPARKAKSVKEKDMPPSKPLESTKSSNVAVAVFNEVLEAYKAQTEKEIRRLIKYGQKWKDQAKKNEAQNAEMQAMIAELQRENQRLKQRLAQSEEAEKLAGHDDLVDSRQKNQEYRFTDDVFDFKQRVIEVTDRGEKHSYRHESRAAKLPTSELVREKRHIYIRPIEPDETLNLEAKVERAYGPIWQDKQNSARSSRSCVQASAEEMSEEDELPLSATPPIKSRVPETQSRPGSSSKPSTLKIRAEPSDVPPVSLRMPLGIPKADLPARSASDTAVPDDKQQRRAAARIRLALRKADRLASAPILSTTTSPAASRHEISKPTESEESQVDWAGL